MSLSFLFHEDVQRIFNNFHALFGIRIAFFAPDGRELKVGNNAGNCRYCQSIRMCPGGAAACYDGDKKGRILAYQRKKLVVYTCHAGLIEVVKPIIQQGNLLGYAMIGQIRTNELPVVYWSARWNSRHEERLEDIFATQPLIAQSHLMQIIEMFSDLMDLLTSANMIDHSGIDVPSRLSGFIQQHIDEAIPLARASSEMHLSASRLSHLVKEHFGISYSALVRQLKMEQARFLLSHYQYMTIAEVAAALGFSDPQYFSRVFRQESEMSPTAYRKQQISPQ